MWAQVLDAKDATDNLKQDWLRRDIHLPSLLPISGAAWWPEVKWVVATLRDDSWRKDRPFLVERWGDYLRVQALARRLEAQLANPQDGVRSCYKCGIRLLRHEGMAGDVRVDYDFYKAAVPPAPFCSEGQPHEAFMGQKEFVARFPERFARIREYHSSWPALGT